MDHAAPEAAPLVRALLDHERQVLDLLGLDLLVLGLLVLDRLARGHPALVERLRDPLPLVPQVCDRLAREVVDHVLRGAPIAQRAA